MENIRITGNVGLDSFMVRRFGGNGIVKGERSVNEAAFYLAAAVHLSEKGSVNRWRHIGVNNFDCCQSCNLRALDSESVGEFNNVFDDIDFDFIRKLSAECPAKIIAEGHIHYPEQAVKALEAGAFALVVGGAITRPAEITARFTGAINAMNK